MTMLATVRSSSRLSGRLLIPRHRIVGNQSAYSTADGRPPLAPPPSASQVTQYERDLFGYRQAKPFVMPDYTPEEQLNRTENANLFRLVYAYRSYGHLAAELDPLNIQKIPPVPELDPARYSIPETGKTYNLTGIIHIGVKGDPSMPRDKAPIELILKHLKRTYCGKIAYEFRHIPSISERRWFAQMIESFDKKQFSAEEKKHIFGLLTRSEVFDQFMHKRFSQVKRYGLEGGESMMVALDSLFRTCGQTGLYEAVVCMPHRGRLNLLTDLFQYPVTALFHKIKGNSEFPDDIQVSGDVLSHLANSVNLDYGASHPLRVTMLHNPSHLEAVNPVAMGKARAKQMGLMDTESDLQSCSLGDRIACIQLHGDAAFSGQGVVMESLGLSALPHFTSGGSIHVVVNNQIGYTTPAMNSRSSIYASDVGKMINAPVIHVNGDYPEEVAYAAFLAAEYRNKFHKDVILDVITYRRWGHNELDEPAFTQPLMYEIIRGRKSVPEIYEEKLTAEGILKAEEIKDFRDTYWKKLDQHLEESRTFKPVADHLKGKWSDIIHPREIMSKCDTGVESDVLKNVGISSVSVPEGMVVHPRLEKFHIQSRIDQVNSGSKIDWATAEAMAIGSLLLEGYNVRISGQDVGRGTFSQRHVMIVDQKTEKTVVPLNNISDSQGKLEVANSSLSEMAVLGFEYGMSLESPYTLNIWEAQFGDFFNGAQIMIDTYLCSGEQKWLRQSGLVMLLPHGYDGAGPEHSSCRMERFLQMSDDRFDVTSTEPFNINWHIINPTTPSQYFHALRRQMRRPFRKPLIVVGPKTLLKLNAAVSNMSELLPGQSFWPVLEDEVASKDSAEKLVFMSGKLYYDLIKERESRNLLEKVAIVRVEELTPFPTEDIASVINQYSNIQEYIWCQEEPQNMGAYTYVAPRLQQLIPGGFNLKYIGRQASAAPATGIGSVHKKEQSAVVRGCFE